MKAFFLIAALPLAACATDRNFAGGYQYDGQYYQSYDECVAAKQRGRSRGAVIGAVGGAAVAAATGGNAGEVAAAAGGGALAGGLVGNSRRC
jgi:hypothetical protein